MASEGGERPANWPSGLQWPPQPPSPAALAFLEDIESEEEQSEEEQAEPLPPTPATHLLDRAPTLVGEAADLSHGQANVRKDSCLLVYRPSVPAS